MSALKRTQHSIKRGLEPHYALNRVPTEMREYIDRVALFVAHMEEDIYGSFSARTRVAEDACRLVMWAFGPRQRSKSRFLAWLESRDTEDSQF